MEFDKHFLIELAQLLAVVSWCDGDLDTRERAIVRELEDMIPELTPDERAGIDGHLLKPDSEEDIDTLIESACKAIDNEQKFQFAKQWLVRVIQADHRVDSHEDELLYRVIRHIKL